MLRLLVEVSSRGRLKNNRQLQGHISRIIAMDVSAVAFWCQSVPWILNNMLNLKYQF